jgi:hypothetical protein
MHDTSDAAFFDDLFGNNSAYALHLAASHGDVPQIYRLVDTGKDIDEVLSLAARLVVLVQLCT